MDQLIVQPLKSALVRVCRWPLLCVLLVLTTSCATDPDIDPAEEGGVVGTGLILRGAVSEQKLLASAELQIKAQSGELSTGVIARDGQYLARSPAGQGPWLLRSDLGNDDYQYGVAHASGKANVHSYTDLVIRSWFVERYGVSDLNAAFESAQNLPELPALQQYRDRSDQYFALVAPVLDRYQLSGQDLLMGDFRNDDQGVDRFLNANPVLIDGRDVTIVKTDLDNNIQSFVKSDILLDDPMQGSPPSMPLNLRAFGSVASDIQLVWDSPADTSSPAVSYTIMRNGSVVASTPFQTYRDNEVQPDTNYLYEVRALGISNRSSSGASVAVDSTIATVDTIAPAAPTALTTLSATTRRAELAWTQDVTDDTIAFDVFRGPAADNLSFLTRVSGTRFVDATVSSGLEYWYAIRALDASGNVSGLTQPVRVLTTGIVIEPPKRPLNLVPPLAGLNVPDTDSLVCEMVFAESVIDDRQVSISPGCYRVEQNINVSNFGVLTLQPGVVLKFEQDTAIKVQRKGVLNSAGTVEQPVVLSATRPTRGWWHGVEFDHTERDLNKISHTVIEYAGGAKNGASIKMVSASNDPAFLSVDHSLIRSGSGYGIAIVGLDAGLQSFSANLITQNERAASVTSSSLQAINDGSDFFGNDLNFMYVARAHYDFDIELSDPGIPLQLGSIDQVRNNPPRSFIINEGVELQFIEGAAFNVQGNLAIRGTAANPVKLTSKNPNPGQWEGLQILQGANAQLSHLIIENAGLASEENPVGASLFAGPDTRLSLDNVTLRFSSSYGFHAADGCINIDKLSQLNRVNNQLVDIVDPGALPSC